MKVNVKYFASLRELMGAAGAEVEVAENASVDELWQLLAAARGIEFNGVMMAVNLEYVKAGHPLKADDEVAFFPPVTGG